MEVLRFSGKLSDQFSHAEKYFPIVFQTPLRHISCHGWMRVDKYRQIASGDDDDEMFRLNIGANPFGVRDRGGRHDFHQFPVRINIDTHTRSGGIMCKEMGSRQ